MLMRDYYFVDIFSAKEILKSSLDNHPVKAYGKASTVNKSFIKDSYLKSKVKFIIDNTENIEALREELITLFATNEGFDSKSLHQLMEQMFDYTWEEEASKIFYELVTKNPDPTVKERIKTRALDSIRSAPWRLKKSSVE